MPFSALHFFPPLRFHKKDRTPHKSPLHFLESFEFGAFNALDPACFCLCSLFHFDSLRYSANFRRRENTSRPPVSGGFVAFSLLFMLSHNPWKILLPGNRVPFVFQTSVSPFCAGCFEEHRQDQLPPYGPSPLSPFYSYTAPVDLTDVVLTRQGPLLPNSQS